MTAKGTLEVQATRADGRQSRPGTAAEVRQYEEPEASLMGPYADLDKDKEDSCGTAYEFDDSVAPLGAKNSKADIVPPLRLKP